MAGEKGIGAVESRFSGILGAAVVGTALYLTLKPVLTAETKESKTNNREGVPSAGPESNVNNPWIEPPPSTGISSIWNAVNQRILMKFIPDPPPPPPEKTKEKPKERARETIPGPFYDPYA